MIRCTILIPFGLINMAAAVVRSFDETFQLEVVQVPGGQALVGTDNPVFPGDGEGPLREIKLGAFQITPTAVSNLQFAKFVSETGYKTEAERFGWSYVFRDAVVDKDLFEPGVEMLPWWCKIEKADWLNPNGSGRLIEGFEHLPVVHVSWNDATAFAMWAGGRLPTEVEWEHAARGGLRDVVYPWGNEEPGANNRKCHFGQINAPELTPVEIGPLPVEAYDANGYGLYNMVGNVWEWIADTADAKANGIDGGVPRKYLKGGSYMCHPDTCYRYRIAARISNSIDTSTGHTGFRIVLPN